MLRSDHYFEPWSRMAFSTMQILQIMEFQNQLCAGAFGEFQGHIIWEIICILPTQIPDIIPKKRALNFDPEATL